VKKYYFCIEENELMTKKRCFVVMGYGEKTDHTTGRKLNLDKTYEHIIKPVVELIGLECKRADEIVHSGIIDVPMYEHLLKADVVIADLSTYNSNAIYELGVRHALKPHTTVVIAERDFKYPFDLNHTVIRNYKHLGEDIGCSEASRFKEELKGAIAEILEAPKIDSPVYTYLNLLTPPSFNETDLENFKPINMPQEEETLKSILELAKRSMDEEKDFVKAKNLFLLASQIDSKNEYIIQKLTLATYKNPDGDKLENLMEALKIIEALKPKKSNDPETLGLTGAIYKRLWDETGKGEFLTKSILFYERGFYIKQDYYNGINLGFLLNLRATLAKDINDYITDFTLAKRVRARVIEICNELSEKDFEERSDQYWILATLEEAYFGLGDKEKYEEYRKQASKVFTASWERETTEEQIKKLQSLLEYSY